MVVLFTVRRPFYPIVQHTKVVDGRVVEGEAVHISEASAGADTFGNI